MVIGPLVTRCGFMSLTVPPFPGSAAGVFGTLPKYQQKHGIWECLVTNYGFRLIRDLAVVCTEDGNLRRMRMLRVRLVTRCGKWELLHAPRRRLRVIVRIWFRVAIAQEQGGPYPKTGRVS
jgi:hypothetical protein